MTEHALPARVPRLGARFLVVVAIGIALAGAGILVVVERTLAAQAERQAVGHARTIAAGILDRRLHAADLERGVDPVRRTTLRRLLSPGEVGGLGGALYTSSGSLVASSARTGAPPPQLLERAAGGTTASAVTGSPRVLRTLLPIRVGTRTGVLELDQGYEQITAASRHSALIVTAILEGLLLALSIVLLPMLARASGRLRRHVEELDHLASHDGLTGLLNRAGFRRHLGEELARPYAHGAVLLVDVEHFHSVNEALGAGHADELLREVAHRLSTIEGASAARLGEDEFALALPTADRRRLAEATAAIVDGFTEPFAFSGIEIAIDVRLGAALYPDHGTNPDDLLRNAGVALANARKAADHTLVYEESLQSTDVVRLSLAAELREAIHAGDIVVHYQPQVALITGRVCGVEALVRWQHPEHGLIPAGEFIELAEQSTVISELGRRVLATSIAQWQRWNDEGIVLDVAVNLSAIDLLDVTLPSTLVDLLLRHQMPADHLVLEITERTFLGDDGKSDRVLRQLERIGVCLAIDDYGTGYSSLAALRKLPITQIKLDRSFVSHIPDDASDDRIVESTIALAHALGATVVAEGVETEAQLRRLTLLDCDVIQGYLVGRAQPADELSAKLMRNRQAVLLR